MPAQMTRWLHLAGLLCLWQACVLQALAAEPFTCTGGMLSIVAHPDDDLLFQSPDLLPYVSGTSCHTAVFLTSGDAGLTKTYSESREAGNDAAYAYMAGVTDSYTEVNITLAGHQVLMRTLSGAPSIQRIYFRFPDGNMDGSGFTTSGGSGQSLAQIFSGNLGSIKTRYGDSWTYSEISSALSTIIKARAPSVVATLDNLSDYGCGDHYDHLTVGRMVTSLAGGNGYMGYPAASFAPNVGGGSLTSKINAFFVYTPYDSAECQSLAACTAAGRAEADWLPRQYIVTSALARKNSDARINPGPVFVTGGKDVPCSKNLASSAKATASSIYPGSSVFAAIDGVISGYPVNETAEWEANSAVSGSLKLTWTTTQSFDTVVLYDRPNSDDQVSNCTLTIGSTVIAAGGLRNDGSPTVIALGKTFSSKTLTFNVTQVTSSTQTIGLSEIQVYLRGSSVCPSSSASSSASASATSSSAQPSGTNIAPLATAVASSFSPSQQASKANDGVIDGYPGDYTKEWASNGEKAGAWLNLTWSQPYTVSSVSLYDRPNLSDNILGGTLTFSDGSKVTVGALAIDGSGNTVTFSPRTITWVRFDVSSTSATTSNVGLAEMQVVGVAAPYSSGISSGTITSSAASSSASGGPVISNIALLATASASSAGANQQASKANDGVPDGYPGDYTKEWATNGQATGAWLRLAWSQSYVVNSIQLYDRPNLDDQITLGAIVFSDGSTLTVGPLINSGAATTYSFPPKTINSLLFTVTGTSSTTHNVGLAEFMVFGYLAPASSTSSSGSISTTSEPQPSSYPNVARLASAKASSQSDVNAQTAAKAIDGVVDGYPGDYTKEWATNGVQIGSYLLLNWTRPYTIYSVTLYDRPNLNDQITKGTLTFSDGTVVPVGTLNNDGSASPVNFTAVTTTSILLTITGVSSTTGGVGLAEFMAFGLPANVASSSGQSSMMSSSASSVVPVPTSSIVSASSTVSSGASSAVSSSGSPQPSGYPDVARLATAKASSQSDANSQTADKAIDGVVDGYPGDYTKEWATDGTQAGTTLLLTWPQPYTIYSVALYDRPNLFDQITGGTLTFSDGSVVRVGSLYNDGSATAVNFTAVTTTSLRFTITDVSSTSWNVGLAELMAFGLPASAPSSSAASSVFSSSAISSLVPVPSSSIISASSLASSSAISSDSALGSSSGLSSQASSDGLSSSAFSSQASDSSVASSASSASASDSASASAESSGGSSGSSFSSVQSSASNGPSTVSSDSSPSSVLPTSSADGSSAVSSDSAPSSGSSGVPSASSSNVLSTSSLDSASSSAVVPTSSETPASSTQTSASASLVSSSAQTSDSPSSIASSQAASSSADQSGSASGTSSVSASSTDAPSSSSDQSGSSTQTYSSSSSSSPTSSSANQPSSSTLVPSSDASVSLSSDGSSSSQSAPLSSSSLASSTSSSADPVTSSSSASSVSSSSSISVLSSQSSTSDSTSSSVSSSSSEAPSKTTSSLVPSASASSTCSCSDPGVVPGYQKCGGQGYTGLSCCQYGYGCMYSNDFYSQCLPISQDQPSTQVGMCTPDKKDDCVCSNPVGAYGKCGGQDWTGSTCCITGYKCEYSNDYFSQCVPGIQTLTCSASSSLVASSTRTSSSPVASSSTSSSSSSSLTFTSSQDATSSTRDPARSSSSSTTRSSDSTTQSTTDMQSSSSTTSTTSSAPRTTSSSPSSSSSKSSTLTSSSKTSSSSSSSSSRTSSSSSSTTTTTSTSTKVTTTSSTEKTTSTSSKMTTTSKTSSTKTSSTAAPTPTNYALDDAVTAQASSKSSTANKVTDGKVSTVWKPSSPALNSWIQLDFPKKVSIASVIVSLGSGSDTVTASSFTFSSGQNFTINGSIDDDNPKTVKLDGVSTSSLRFNVDGLPSKSASVSVGEIAVYLS